MTDLNLGVIGNCQIASLIDSRGVMVWTCLPQLDGDPTFCRLLRSEEDRHLPGYYAVELLDFERSEQRYIENTPILETLLYDRHGGVVKITDYAPRYPYMGRMFRPMMLIRGIEPLAGSPRVRIRLNPARSYGREACEMRRGSNHIRYIGSGLRLRLTTDVSITRVLDQSSFVLDRRLHLVLGPDESIPEAVSSTYRNHLESTEAYWRGWSRGLAIPFEWQAAVIRAAITLKLCTFEDTGAVIAAMTTSIPEAAGSGRNWDYRYCWLRDSYFVVNVLNRLGATKTMEEYLRYIIDVGTAGDDTELQPVYAISGRADLQESMVASLSGYRGMGPVRLGNQAFEQNQHDVYGAIILSSMQMFFDRRLTHPGRLAEFRLLEQLGAVAVRVYDQPDAGLWEYRGRKRVHTFSSLMCWAACDRLARIAARLGETDRAKYWKRCAKDIHAKICEAAWDDKQKSFTESFGRPEMDASLLMMHYLGFLQADDPRFVQTVHAIERHLKRGQHIFRYAAADDFGEPENAFNICTFWYIDALASIGREEEARELYEHMLSCRNPLGMLSEDIDPTDNALWGNFPQTYSMAGIVDGAMRLSRAWDEAI